MLRSYIAVKALIQNKDTFLILKTKDSDQNDKLAGWETPGGRLEDGEEILFGLKREIVEETGLEINVLFPFNVYSGNTTLENAIIGINFLAEHIDGDIKIDKREHSKFMWATVQQIKQLVRSVGLQKEIDAYNSFLNKLQKAKEDDE